MKTPKQVRAEFERRGETLAHWARKHDFAYGRVRDVLRGKAKGRYGDAHKIAVMLGIKDGVIVEE